MKISNCCKVIIALAACIVLGSHGYCFAQEVRIFKIKHARASDLAPVASSLKTTDGKVSADDNTNSLIVIDYPQIIERIARVVDELDVPRGQVEIKVVIVDVTERLLRKAGILSTRVILPSGAGNAVLKMITGSKDSRARSEMTVRTLSGSAAQLQVSVDEIFGKNVVLYPNGTIIQELERKPVGDFLEALPYVNNDGTILVTLRPSQSKVKSGHEISENSILTQVRLHSGDTLAIGGVDSKTDSSGKSDARKVMMFLSAKIVE